MATYDYNCNKCEVDVEKQHGMTEIKEYTCENCGNSLHKVIRSSSFHLKGNGWFKKTSENK